jgi:SAM-dependent methyltransferase
MAGARNSRAQGPSGRYTSEAGGATIVFLQSVLGALGSSHDPVRTRRQAVTRWWESYFDEDFLRIYRPLLGPEETREEALALMEILGIRRGAAILDVGCGWGRHAIELAALGFQVTGYDLSRRLLEEAESGAATAGVEVRWVLGDMRDLPFEKAFDAALSLFSSLGYFDEDEDDLRVLLGIHRALRPGGVLVLDTMHRDLIAREFVERDWWSTPDGDTVWVEREFDAVAGISRERLRWRRPSGDEGEKEHTIRIRAATEWRILLESAGFTVEGCCGGWDLDEFSHTSGRLVMLARRD